MQTIYATFKYDDAVAGIDFLERAFGFERHAVHERDGGLIAHAELRFGDDVVMLGSVGAGDPRFDRNAGHASVYLAVDDVDALHHRAAAAGAEMVRPLTDQDYGSREFSASDPEGNIWSFGTYRPQLDA